MKMSEAMQIINRPLGYRVQFKVPDYSGSVEDFIDDRFPDYGEELIMTPEEAWKLAEKFAKKRPDCFDVRVVNVDEVPLSKRVLNEKED